jgi:hypothetical protein
MSLLEPAASDTSGNVLAGLDLVASLEGDEDFTDAFRLLGSLRAASTRDPDLRRLVAKRTQSLESARSASERIRPSLEKLTTTPRDTAANLAVGSYYCLRLRQWDKGLPFLANGSDMKMRELAAAELLTATDAGKAVEIADRWWEYSEAKGTPVGDARAIKLHAASLYEKGRGTVTGLGAKMVEARLKQAAQIGSDDDESVPLEHKHRRRPRSLRRRSRSLSERRPIPEAYRGRAKKVRYHTDHLRANREGESAWEAKVGRDVCLARVKRKELGRAAFGNL